MNTEIILKNCLSYFIVVLFLFQTGSGLAQQAVLRAKEQVRVYSRQAPSMVPCAPIHEGPPPPYSPTNHTNSTPYNPHYTPQSFSPEAQGLDFASENLNPFHINSQTFGSHRSLETSEDGSIRETSPNTNPFNEEDARNRYVFTYVNKEKSKIFLIVL